MVFWLEKQPEADGLSWPPDAEKAVKSFLFKILKKSEIEKVYSSGIRANSRYFTLVYLPEDEFGCGISISKKHGNAVIRNKLRRQIKEIMRELSLKLSTSINIVLIPKIGITGLKFNEIHNNLLYILKKAKIGC